jgi:hypothetical protein
MERRRQRGPDAGAGDTSQHSNNHFATAEVDRMVMQLTAVSKPLRPFI